MNSIELADDLRIAVAVTRAHAHGDEGALRALLDPVPVRKAPDLLAALTNLVIAAQASTSHSLDDFLDGYLADINYADVVAGVISEQAQRLEQGDDEPDPEP